MNAESASGIITRGSEYIDEIRGKTIAVIGLGISGEGVLSALETLGIPAYVIDRKQPAALRYGEYLALSDADGIAFDLAIISPGVPLSSPEARYFIDRGVELIGEIEFSYRLGSSDYVCITGTNGKTTTTSLCGAVFQRFVSSCVVGNIGIAAAPHALEAHKVLVTEVSSFQIETLSGFQPAIVALLNITPDHLDRHGTMEAYTALKLDLLRRARIKVLNADCAVLRELRGAFPDAYSFSVRERVERGAFVEHGKIYVVGMRQATRVAGESAPTEEAAHYVCDLSDIHLMGAHNVENVLAAVLVSSLYGIPAEIIRGAVQDFRAVEHRIEYVRTVRGVRFYNDSKGTNPDSTIKAIEAMDAPCHLIAGGYEKNSDFTELLEIGKGKIASLSLLGVTAERIAKRALELGYEPRRIGISDTLKEATLQAFAHAKEGEIVLLSPASASWGMYANFEERGRDFKNCVMEMVEDDGE